MAKIIFRDFICYLYKKYFVKKNFENCSLVCECKNIFILITLSAQGRTKGEIVILLHFLMKNNATSITTVAVILNLV